MCILIVFSVSSSPMLYALDCGGNWSTLRKSTPTRRKHADLTQKDLLAKVVSSLKILALTLAARSVHV